MMLIEKIKLKINKFIRTKYSNLRRKKLKNEDFTIISNNCWSGTIYESYNLKKLSPTIGLFFMSNDYIKFISNIKYYLSLDIEFIDPNNSNYYDYICKEKNFGKFPIGKLGDIEIFFLHYKNRKEVLSKWNRRKKRINWNKIIFKFNDQNLCDAKNVEDFVKLPYKNKLFFTVNKKFIKDKNCHRFFQFPNKKYIMASNEPFGNNHVLNITNYLNNIQKETYFDN